jgi:hypothetical protein
MTTAIDTKVTKLKNESAVLFDVPDLQKLRVGEVHRHISSLVLNVFSMIYGWYSSTMVFLAGNTCIRTSKTRANGGRPLIMPSWR